MTTRFRLPALLLSLVLLCGCGSAKKEQAQAPVTPSPSPTSPVQAAGMPTPTPTPEPTPAPTPTPEPVLSCEVTQTAAYYFEDMGCLYAAVEFTNTGNVNAVVDTASVSIAVGAKTVSDKFTPAFADMDIIEPGETSTIAGWFSYNGSAPKEGDQTIAAAQVTLRAAPVTQEKPLELTNLLIVQNYPGFATVSGSMTNLSGEKDCSLTTVYLSFYDAHGNLLGVQYFSKNLSVPAGEARDFVYHLRSLPIPDLTANTAVIIGRGMGVN